MQLRISNGCSHSVAFHALDAGGFASALAQAWERFDPPLSPDRAELHVQTASGEWIAPTYRYATSATTPDGRRVLPNTPTLVRRGVAPLDYLWEWCREAYNHGNQFEGQMLGLGGFASDTPEDQL